MRLPSLSHSLSSPLVSGRSWDSMGQQEELEELELEEEQEQEVEEEVEDEARQAENV